MKTAWISIVSKEYIPYYKVLFNSLKKHTPSDHRQLLYYINTNPNETDTFPLFDVTIDITDKFMSCNKEYNTLERICSLRAAVVLDAFYKGYDNVVFCGAKLEFYDKPKELVMPLFNGYNAVVTPHIMEPLPEDGKFPSNASVSFTGHISTDLVSFRKCPEIIKFLEWQDEIMKTKGKTTKETYLDQSWFNFLPFFVDNVKILRDPAYNQAYWNHKQREGIKPVCFQFSGLDLNNLAGISTHQNREVAEGNYLNFLTDYAEKVKQ